MRVAPSILSADFARLADEVASVERDADMIHVDVMDAHFVPDLTIGPPVVRSLRRHTRAFLDCHLMVEEPRRLLEPLAEAGANGCSVHVEAGDPTAALVESRRLGLRAGLVVNPPTAIDDVVPYLEMIDLLLVMSVTPGRGGQPFRYEALPKIERARSLVDRLGLSVQIQVDGGIDHRTAALAAKAGADVLVAGSAVFGADDPGAAARRIREAGTSAFRAPAGPGAALAG